MDKTSLGDRMKAYERSCEQTLMRRVPVVVRVDGKGFSKVTKRHKCEKPFDDEFASWMHQAMVKTAEKIEGCVFGYVQSDEITFVLRNDQSLESEPWFGNRLQKVCSVVSSMVTAHFNNETWWDDSVYFDARVFTVPDLDEAANALVWRQNDATKNSISTACYYEVGKKLGRGTTRKKMHGLNQDQQQELLFQEVGINWNGYPAHLKRGCACYRKFQFLTAEDDSIVRRKWEINRQIPIFTQNREWLMNKLNEFYDEESVSR